MGQALLVLRLSSKGQKPSLLRRVSRDKGGKEINEKK